MAVGWLARSKRQKRKMPFPSDMDDTSFNDDWIKKPESAHPVLCVARDDGILLVIGDVQSMMKLTPKEQVSLGVDIIEKALRRRDEE